MILYRVIHDDLFTAHNLHVNNMYSDTARTFRLPFHDVTRDAEVHDRNLMSYSEREATVVMDITGCIVECNVEASDLLGRSPESLTGQDITVVLPALPFSQETPGYNLTYVGINHAKDAWQKNTASTPSGGAISVEVLLYITKRSSNYFIALRLRRPMYSATDSPDYSGANQNQARLIETHDQIATAQII